jgi:hypothetical protein
VGARPVDGILRVARRPTAGHDSFNALLVNGCIVVLGTNTTLETSC